MRHALEEAHVGYGRQVQVGRYRVDFVVRNIVIEADGERWHPDRATAQKSAWAARRFVHGVRRDDFLRKSGYQVVHLRGSAIRKDPKGALFGALEELGYAIDDNGQQRGAA